MLNLLMSSARRLDALARMPAELACEQLQHQARLQRGLIDLLRGSAALPEKLLASLRDSAGSVLALPFELARVQHAARVLGGTLPLSLLESARFEQQLGAIERLALGPLARRV